MQRTLLPWSTFSLGQLRGQVVPAAATRFQVRATLVTSLDTQQILFLGAAVPHAMVKVGIDVSTSPRQAGYISDDSPITGISLMHDEGTGGNTLGGYGIFPLFPLGNCSFTACPVGISARTTLRQFGNASDRNDCPSILLVRVANNFRLQTQPLDTSTPHW